jgi:proteasome accessory factor A
MSPFATALKIGTTACVLSLLEDGRLPRNLVLTDAVQSTRDISRDRSGRWIVDLENGETIGALDVQWQFYDLAQKRFRNRSAETNWLLESWSFVLEALERNPYSLIGGVDWITKKWLLEILIESEGLSWSDPWLQSVDLEYHNIDPERGLFFGVTPGKRILEWNNGVRRHDATRTPPANTRASGRARAVAGFQQRDQSYVINWDSIACDSRDFLVMGDPFKTYNDEVAKFLSAPRPAERTGPDEKV